VVPASQGFWAVVLRLARTDAALLRRYPRVRLAALGVALVPALYALIYLISVWNPSARTGTLPVLIVNADRGFATAGRQVRLGEELVRRLLERPAFGYQMTDDEAQARHEVRAGLAQFALLIAPDFSERAVPGTEAGAARIVIYTSEGNDYSGAGFAKNFAPELARQVNEALNRERWTLVLRKAAGAQVSLDELHLGVDRLLAASRELAQGSAQLRHGAAELSQGIASAQDGAQGLRQGSSQSNAAASRLGDGLQRLGGGLRGVSARLPAEAEVQALDRGAQSLLAGQLQLGQGLTELHDGALQLQQGVERFKAEGERLLLVGDRIGDGAAQLHDGAGRLAQGLGQARDASGQLSEGARGLQQGTRTLVDNLLPLGAGLRQLSQSLPADDELSRLTAGLGQLDSGVAGLAAGLQALGAGGQRLAGGLQRLESGTVQLATGLQALASALPDPPPIVSGSPGGLAGSVQPVVEVVAPVPANGAGYAPSFIAVALWAGATLCSFIWPLRRLPDAGLQGPGLALALGKLMMPGLLACVQALAVLVILKTALPVVMPGGWQLVVTLLASSLTFLALLLALVRLLGETGKAVALLLLITQISAAGGNLPVALTTDFHRAIHPFLPFTWAIRALRAAMFGAFEGAWGPAVAGLGLAGLLALLAAAFVGRWKRVPPEDYRPALDID
jgi:putative membrane protein